MCSLTPALIHSIIIAILAFNAYAMKFNDNKYGEETREVGLMRKGACLLLGVLGIAFSWYYPVFSVVATTLALLNCALCLKDKDAPNVYYLLYVGCAVLAAVSFFIKLHS